MVAVGERAATAARPGEAACEVCGGGAWAPLVVENGYQWVRCAECGFARLSPMPDLAAAGEIQSPEVARDYIRTLTAKADSKMRRSRRRVRHLRRRMRGPDMLDVGSNIGCFVEAGREIGLRAVGLDINPDLVAYARERYPECEFVCGALEDVDFGDRRFDGIYTSEVIEHVVDPNGFLAGIFRLLKPGGVLYLTTPDLGGYRQKAPPGWKPLGAPDHKLYFTPENMRRMLVRHGFTDVRFRFNVKPGIKLFARRGEAAR